MLFSRARSTLAGWARAFAVVLASTLLFAATPSGAQSTTWLYTAMGDSLAVGIWAFRGYVPRYQSYIKTDTGRTVSLRNIAQSGWTSDDLLNALNTDPNFISSVRSAKVITFDIGGNDLRHAREDWKEGICDILCLDDTVRRFQANWNDIVAIVLREAPVGAIIRTMTLYNPYVDEDRADGDFATLKTFVDAVNSHITTSSGGIRVAKVYEAFNGPNGDIDPQRKGYLSFDRLHPNDTGHKVIADQFRLLGYTPSK